jgi:superfamily I DNA/RNA helicase
MVRLLRDAGQKPADVIVLGPRRRDGSLLGDVRAIGGWSVRDLVDAGAGDLSYSTIHAFKGLERPVVIVVDADAASRDEADALLYVAMSRARLRLFILAPETARAAIEARLTMGALAAAGLRPS